MNILEDIQAAATDSRIPLPDLLRKCAVLAARLRNEEFKMWVNHELNGYPNVAELPSYRKLKAHSLGHFVGGFGSSLSNAPIPPSSIPKDFRHHVEESPIPGPIASLTEMLEKGTEGTFQVSWPADLVVMVGQNIYQDMNCLKAWKVVSRGQLVGLVDTVRNRILAFVLELEAESPDPGEWPSRSVPISEAKIRQVFNTHITGDVGNVVTGSHDFAVQSFDVQPGDLESLTLALRALGFQSPDLDELKTAIEKDGPSATKKSLGKAVSLWIGGMIRKASEGALGVAAKTAATTITDLILRYYGLS